MRRQTIGWSMLKTPASIALTIPQIAAKLAASGASRGKWLLKRQGELDWIQRTLLLGSDTRAHCPLRRRRSGDRLCLFLLWLLRLPVTALLTFGHIRIS
jgi:hypothetical protein